MNLQGKKAVFLGDSITQGHGTSSAEHIYLHLLKQEAGLREVVNYGISGTRIARQVHPTPNAPQFDADFCMRAEKLDDDADIIIVFGGSNDFGHGDAPVGDPADRTPETFYGACHYLMNYLSTRFWDKTIVVLTPLHRLDENDCRDGRPPLREFVRIIRDTAEFYSIPVLDLYKNSRIQPIVPIVQQQLCPDGLHPNDAGHALLAHSLYQFLQQL